MIYTLTAVLYFHEHLPLQILFGLPIIQYSWKLFPRHCGTTARKHFFYEHVGALWYCLNINNENLRFTTSFKRLIKGSDLSPFVY